MGQAHYLTIRCPLGCEAWFQPSSIERHLEPGRCRRHPWVDDLPDAVVVPAPLSGLIVPLLPPALVDDAEHPEIGSSRRQSISLDFRLGRRIRSPIEGVRARRWLYVATAVLEQRGLQAVKRTLTPGGFAELERVVVRRDEEAECRDCGEFVTRRGLGAHRATSAACRWRRAAAEVRTAWEAGWRDPFNVEGAPLTWGELSSRVQWRRRVLAVTFPRWTAVLLKAGDVASMEQRTKRNRASVQRGAALGG